MAYTQGLGPCAARREGASPSPPTLRLASLAQSKLSGEAKYPEPVEGLF